MRAFLTCVLLAVMFGCASTGTIITKNNNKIERPLYSISIPPNAGWQLRKDTRDPTVVFLYKQPEITFYGMRFSTNLIANKEMKTWTAKQVADHYRNDEKQNMINRGVMTGQYELQDVAFDSEMIGGKRFYIMSYKTVYSEGIQSASLYLYFPQNENISDFMVALYLASYEPGETPSQSPKSEFIETLGSLRFRDKSEQ
jgi:hypothetical protein